MKVTAAQNKPLSDLISKNQFPLFNEVLSKVKSKTKQQIASLKSNCNLFGRMFIGCQVRQGDMKVFFGHEYDDEPPSISEGGDLKQAVKPDLVECLEKLVPPVKMSPHVDVKVLDGAVIVHLLKPQGSRTFEEYSKNIFLPHIELQLENVSRVDIVWDSYLPNSLKQSARQRRTKSSTIQRQRVNCNSPIPTN